MSKLSAHCDGPNKVDATFQQLNCLLINLEVSPKVIFDTYQMIRACESSKRGSSLELLDDEDFIILIQKIFESIITKDLDDFTDPSLKSLLENLKSELNNLIEESKKRQKPQNCRNKLKNLSKEAFENTDDDAEINEQRNNSLKKLHNYLQLIKSNGFEDSGTGVVLKAFNTLFKILCKAV